MDPPLDRQRARVPHRQPRRPAARRAARRRRHRHRGRRPGVPLLRRPRGSRQPRHCRLERRRQHLAQEPGRRAERRRRPPVVRRRQRHHRDRRRQHRLPRLPRKRGRYLHLLEPRLDRLERPGRRPRLAERLGQRAEAARGRRDVRADPLRQADAEPLLRLQRGQARPPHDRPRQARPAHRDRLPQRDAARLAGRRRARPPLPGVRDRRGRERLRRLDRHQRQRRLLLVLDRQGRELDDAGSREHLAGQHGRVPLGAGRQRGHARARVVRDRHGRPAGLVPELGRRPAGRDDGQVVGLRGHDQQRRLALADDRAAAVHGEADALRPDLQPGHRLHGRPAATGRWPTTSR